jgi:hypothetical protein
MQSEVQSPNPQSPEEAREWKSETVQDSSRGMVCFVNACRFSISDIGLRISFATRISDFGFLVQWSHGRSPGVFANRSAGIPMVLDLAA